MLSALRVAGVPAPGHLTGPESGAQQSMPSMGLAWPGLPMYKDCLLPPRSAPAQRLVDARLYRRMVQLVTDPAVLRASNIIETVHACGAELVVAVGDYGGTFDPRAWAVVLNPDMDLDHLSDIVTHELSHLLQFSLDRDVTWGRGYTLSQHVRLEQQAVSLSMLLKPYLFPFEPRIRSFSYFDTESLQYLTRYLAEGDTPVQNDVSPLLDRASGDR